MAGPAGWHRAWVRAVVLAVGGCRLVDQTSFGNAPRPPAPDALAAALASPATTPLLVIEPDDGVPYQQTLHAALDAAQAHGASRFRLDSVAPLQGGLNEQQTALGRAAMAARAIMDEMGEDGVPPDRIDFGARSDQAVTRIEIRLYQD